MRFLPAFTALLALGACRENGATGPGTIDVAWTGADTGRLRLAASARWCAEDSLVEITGSSGDSGVALALMPVDTAITPGVFPVGLPLRVRGRPGARVAIRWRGEPLTQGYYGMSGTVTIDSAAGLRGRLEATLRSVHDERQISLSGTFRGLAILSRSAEPCGSPSHGLPEPRLP
jgi:hypothetical protein